jgi:hypothetical protein
MNDKLKSEIGKWIVRTTAGADLLDPTLDSLGALWNRGRGVTEQSTTRTDDAAATNNWLLSPFYRLLESGERTLRRGLDATYRRGEFSLLDAFQDQGATDYARKGVARPQELFRLDPEGLIPQSPPS